jgi:hypothetical protein
MADVLADARTLPVRPENEPLFGQCERIVTRLHQDNPVQELDALVALCNERDFEVVARIRPDLACSRR